MKTALTLSGSTRRDSYNRILQHHIGAKLSEAGAAVTELDLREFPMPVFSEDIEDAGESPPAAAVLAQMFGKADIVFIASPEYNSGVTPLILNMISWISRQKHWQFRHAVFGLGAVSSGKYGGVVGIAHLRDTLSKLGALVVPTLLGVGPADQAFDGEGRPVEPAIIRKCDQIVREMMNFHRGGI